ncbi:MAG: indole-3-glycerol-phosphate synthase [Methanomicrobiales archaeon]|nr:indole-3-glycerol-phosphate synthase [Methanomicrobiales archaeon]
MILEHILEATRQRVANLPDKIPLSPRTLDRSLSRAIDSRRKKNAIIGELKFSSPLDGQFREPVQVAPLAQELIEGGCIALSVLTVPTYFGGSPQYLSQVQRVTTVPVLRKDFIIDEKQVYETRSMGADAILLIALLLGNDLASFVTLSLRLGIEPVVEVHTPEEVEIALSTDATIIGINNRDLRTMEVDISTTELLAPLCEPATRISMSGITRIDDIVRLKGCCEAFLIGSVLMRSSIPRKTAEGFVSA